MEVMYLKVPMQTIVKDAMKKMKPKKGDVIKYEYYFDPVKDVVIFELFVEIKEGK